jgi:hypothetical protein
MILLGHTRHTKHKLAFSEIQSVVHAHYHVVVLPFFASTDLGVTGSSPVGRTTESTGCISPSLQSLLSEQSTALRRIRSACCLCKTSMVSPSRMETTEPVMSAARAGVRRKGQQAASEAEMADRAFVFSIGLAQLFHVVSLSQVVRARCLPYGLEKQCGKRRQC